MAHPALLLVLFLLSSPAISSSKRILPKFSAIFYFGDSVLDTGNNNRLPTVALANHVPYGGDFPGKKPTGRFSNGRLVPDLLNERLQLKEFSPPYLDSKLSNNDIMTGVNFASAGSGFDDQTSLLTNTLPMSKQMNLFKDYLLRLRDIVGDKDASRIIANSLIFISSGTNDFSHYYRSSKKRKMDIGEYQDTVLQMAQAYVKVYNSKLQELLPVLQGSLHGSKIVYLDAYRALMEILEDPEKYGNVFY
ncbi:GDSL esterase/lipase [Dichanthelium oligosanthes]|uniref:GDSL esterase/lipase n=1 Tax=Dichanthelium oligosanthes TaxID=888268 RepID=A0A1E5V8V6_9POAL|nr:GDSL esterase/lipase [Dichanthelium oligosanthes]